MERCKIDGPIDEAGERVLRGEGAVGGAALAGYEVLHRVEGGSRRCCLAFSPVVADGGRKLSREALLLAPEATVGATTEIKRDPWL